MKLFKNMKSELEPKLGMPTCVSDQSQYVVYTGSIAYGVSDDTSDLDVIGFCIPNKDIIFPHLAGEVLGFGKQKQRFEQYQQHHIKFREKEYDISIYNIVKFFQLCMENNPNMVDVLFVPQRCILHSTQIGNYVRENRKEFLHKGSYQKFKGYGYSQIHKMNIKEPEGKRKENVDKYGYDTKFAYHCIRLLLEVEQILIEHDLNIEQNSEILKSIRRGEWSKEKVIEFFNIKEKTLDELYVSSTLRYSPDEEKIKSILINSLEMHFGNLSQVIPQVGKEKKIIEEIVKVLSTNRII